MADQAKDYEQIDRQITSFLDERDFEDRWLMKQMHLTAETRRAIIDALPIRDGFRILDVGTGFGALPVEIASRWAVEVHGIDNDLEKIRIADEIRSLVSESVAMRGVVRFRVGDAYELPYEDSGFDLVVAWHVYQHLESPERATAEIFRVLRPGGFVCLVDADDQLALTYPDPLPERALLTKAFNHLQAQRGGDRFVGRKLSTYLQTAGFENINAVVRMEASHGKYRTTDVNHRLLIEHFSVEKQALIADGILTEETFAECIEALSEPRDLGYRFTSNGLFIALASRPLPG